MHSWQPWMDPMSDATIRSWLTATLSAAVEAHGEIVSGRPGRDIDEVVDDAMRRLPRAPRAAKPAVRAGLRESLMDAIMDACDGCDGGDGVCNEHASAVEAIRRADLGIVDVAAGVRRVADYIWGVIGTRYHGTTLGDEYLVAAFREE